MSFSRYLQENLLVLLSFDKERCRVIRNTVEPQLFGGVYKELVTRIYTYIDKHKAPPGEHIADVVEDKLESDNKRERNTYKDILESLYDMREGINAEYVMSQLEDFVRRQSYRSIAVELTKALQRDTEESLDEAERLIRSATTKSLQVFDPGLRMSNIDKALAFLDFTNNAFPTGIEEFDRRGFGPTRGEMLLYIADTKTGKTWCMVHLSKIVLMSQLRTVHISLEMSEDKVAQRYIQAFFAVAKRKDKVTVRRFKKGKGGFDFETKELKPKYSFDQPNIRKKLRGKLEQWQKRVFDNIIIKQFPTGKLSVRELEAYLDNLEVTEGFVPDLLIVDYPDLMRIDKGNQYRISLGEVYKDLRGVAVARNLALAVPTQSNRAGAGAKSVGRQNVSESYAKIADADTVITYSQTDDEKKLGLARLKVIAGRNDEDNIEICLSQNYTMGQYVIDSILMPKDYFKTLEIEDDSSDYIDDDEDDE